MAKGAEYFSWIEDETRSVLAEDVTAHHSYVQTALHPLLLRAPFVYRTFAKPLGYAGDYEMVNQLLGDPQQGTSTYFQIVNTQFIQAAVAEAHRNRINILVDYLHRAADLAQKEQRQVSILNVGCGPAVEIARFIETHPNPADALSDAATQWPLDELDNLVARTLAVWHTARDVAHA